MPNAIMISSIIQAFLEKAVAAGFEPALSGLLANPPGETAPVASSINACHQWNENSFLLRESPLYHHPMLRSNTSKYHYMLH